MIVASEDLRDRLTQRSGRISSEAIVDLQTRATMGYEALGRGTHSWLSTNPSELFRLAEQCRLACELSRLFRRVAAEEAAHLPGNARVFVNLHPAEMSDHFFLD